MRDPEELNSVKYTQRVMEYTVSARLLRFHKKFGRGICGSERCELPIEVGDRIVRYYTGRVNTRLFHKKCAQELNII